MRIFVTVGTTRFNTLVEVCDRLASKSSNDFVVQHANSDQVLHHASGKEFYKNITKEYTLADVVITHAGAGSVFRLLEMNKVIIVVPNFERIDKHQYDIARYVEENHYGLVCWKLNMLEALLSQSRLFIPTQYSKEEFFKFEEITQMIKSL